MGIKDIVISILLVLLGFYYIKADKYNNQIKILELECSRYSTQLEYQNNKILELKANIVDTSNIDKEVEIKINSNVDNTLDSIDKELYEFSKGN